jgi:hypothetical protein
MSGIFDQLPQISVTVSLRDSATLDFQAVMDGIPTSAEDLLGDLPQRLNGLLGAVPGDPSTLLQPLQGFLSGAQGAVEIDLSAAVEAVGLGMSQTRDGVAQSPMGQLVFAAGETRNLRDILMQQVPALTEDFLTRLDAMRDSVLDPETVQMLLDFAATIEDFSSNLPDDPAELADFLAKSFLGLPSTLLAQPSLQADALLGQLDVMASLEVNSDVRLPAQTLALQLQATADLLVRLDLNVEADYQLVLDSLTAIRAALQAFASGVQSVLTGLGGALDAINLAQFSADFSAAIGAIPVIDVTGLDEIKVRILAPIQRLNALFSAVNPEALIDGVKAQLGELSSGLDELGLDRWQAEVLGFFTTVKAAIEGLDLASIRTQVESALSSVSQQIGQLGGDARQTLVAAVEAPLNRVEQAVDGIDLTGVNASIDQVFAELQGLLDKLSIPDLQTELANVTDSLNGVVNDLATQAAAFAGQIEGVVAGLGDLQLDPVTIEVIGQIDEMKASLDQIDPESLGPIQQGALAAASVALHAVDFEVSISGLLLGRFDEMAALPKGKLADVASRIDAFSGRVLSFDPEVLLRPLSDLYQQIIGPVGNFDPGAALQPLADVLDQVRSAFDAVSPARLRGPLDDLYQPLLQALDKLAPAALLQPVSDVYDRFEEALRKIDPVALLDELVQLLDDLFARIRLRLIDHVQSLGLPQPINDFLTSLEPLLTLASPTVFVDPVGKLIELMDTALEGFRPGDLFKPLQQLYDQLRALLSQIAEAVLIESFERVRSTIVTALSRIDPSALPKTIGGRIEGAADFSASLDPGALASALNGPYQSLKNALAGIDEAAVPAPLQDEFDQILALVAQLDPAVVLAPLGASHAALTARFSATGSVDLSGLTESFSLIRQRIEALIPDFLREPITAETLTAGLDVLRPDAIAAEVNAAFDQLKARLTAIRPQLVAELQAFTAQQGSSLAVFDLRALAARLGEVYTAVLTQVSALDPEPMVAALQGIFDTVRQQVADLNPVFIVDELTETFERVKGKLDELGLGTIEAHLDGLWQNVEQKVESLDPAELLRSSGLLESFGNLKDALASISISVILDALDEAFVKLRAELEAELEKTQTAFRSMVDAIPVSVSVEISL